MASIDRQSTCGGIGETTLCCSLRFIEEIGIHSGLFIIFFIFYEIDSHDRILISLPEQLTVLISYLTTEEPHNAERSMVRMVQEESFPNEIRLLSSGASVARTSSLRSFNRQIDDNGIVRIYGRLAHSEESH